MPPPRKTTLPRNARETKKGVEGQVASRRVPRQDALVPQRRQPPSGPHRNADGPPLQQLRLLLHVHVLAEQLGDEPVAFPRLLEGHALVTPWSLAGHVRSHPSQKVAQNPLRTRNYIEKIH